MSFDVAARANQGQADGATQTLTLSVPPHAVPTTTTTEELTGTLPRTGPGIPPAQLLAFAALLIVVGIVLALEGRRAARQRPHTSVRAPSVPSP
jgi:hypothetical protein